MIWLIERWFRRKVLREQIITDKFIKTYENLVRMALEQYDPRPDK